MADEKKRLTVLEKAILGAQIVKKIEDEAPDQWDEILALIIVLISGGRMLLANKSDFTS